MFEEDSQRAVVLMKHRELSYRHVNGSAAPSDVAKKWMADGIEPFPMSPLFLMEDALAKGIAIGEVYERRAVVFEIDRIAEAQRTVGLHARADICNILKMHIERGDHAYTKYLTNDELAMVDTVKKGQDGIETKP